MHVCLCRGITTSDILNELAKRPETVCRAEDGVSAEFAEEIHTRCSDGLGYNCGTCSDTVKEIIDGHYAPVQTGQQDEDTKVFERTPL